jgi:hypothetical protein
MSIVILGMIGCMCVAATIGLIAAVSGMLSDKRRDWEDDF